jgi:hypothetical protein
VPRVARSWAKVRVAEANAALKLEMVRRGMSAGEIRAVRQAPDGSGEGHGEERVRRRSGRWE